MGNGCMVNWHFSWNLHFCLHFGCHSKGSKMGEEVKYHINCQLKHGLSDSSVKTGKFYLGADRSKKRTFWVSNIKMPFRYGTPPTCTLNLVYITAGGFRGPKSSNRIKISWFVQVLLHFNWFQGSPHWGWMGWVDVGGWIWVGVGEQGVPCMHAHTWMHAHAHTNTYMHYKHDKFMQMAAPIGKSLGNPYDVICTCMCVHAHACMYGTCPHTPTPAPTHKWVCW